MTPRFPFFALLLLGMLVPRPAAAALRIAVLEFTAASTDATLAPLGKGLQSMICTDLSQVQALTVVERDRLNEVVAEQERSRSAAFDPATAARVGGLLGASHLVVGSFTVVGSTMRLDARLLDAQTGRAVTARSVEGEKDAFFELEKALVQAVLEGLGLALAPKERAAVARLHTADFAAFNDFSAGIDLFDREAYDEAIARLQQASSRDTDFKLARVTLEDYARILGELRARSDELQASQQALERLGELKEAQDEAEVARRLFVLAGRKGESAVRERLTAAYLLTVAYANLGTNRGKLSRLRAVEDRFAMERTAEAIAAAYHAEAVGLFPAITPVPSERFYRALPAPAEFDVAFADAVEELWESGKDYPENRRNALLDDLRYTSDLARLLHLDAREEVALLERFGTWAAQLEPGDYQRNELREALIKAYRSVLRLDESTALLTASTVGETNPYALKGIADAIEQNRDLAALLEGAGTDRREFVLLAQDAGWATSTIGRFWTEHFADRKAPTPEGLRQLNRFRDVGVDDPLLLGSLPVWVWQAPWALVTDARVDLRRATSLRFHRVADGDPTEPFVVLGGIPTADLEARFELRRPPARDAWPPDLRDDGAVAGQPPPVATGSPALHFLFGLRDLAVDEQENPTTGEDELRRPTEGFAVAFEEGRVRLLSLRETERGPYERKLAWEERELGSQALAGWESLPVVITVRGASVEVRAGKKTLRFTLPEERAGFAGLLWRGSGYLEVADVALHAGAR